MTGARVIVIGETASLGVAVTDLLLSDGIDAALVDTLPAGEELAAKSVPDRPTVVVAAANGSRCETLRQWARSPLVRCDLVVVGRREGAGRYGPRVHVIELPMRPLELLVLVRTLLGLATIGTPTPNDARVVVNRHSLLGVPASTSIPRGLAPAASLPPVE